MSVYEVYTIFMNKTLFAGVVLVVLLGVGAVWAFSDKERGIPYVPPGSISSTTDNGTATTSTVGGNTGGGPVACPALAKACPDGSYVSPTGPHCEFPACPSGAGQSGVHGVVQLGPTCPVEQNPPDPQCADRPYATTITARTMSGAVVKTAQSASNGTFTLTLPAGTYTLTAAGGHMLPRCADVSVTVRSGVYASTTIFCDTGIR